MVKELVAIGVPAAMIKSLDEVFETQEAQDLILEEDNEGILTRRVKSIVYQQYD